MRANFLILAMKFVSCDPQRINFLEALEVAFNIGNDPRGDILHAQRDFNA